MVRPSGSIAFCNAARCAGAESTRVPSQSKTSARKAPAGSGIVMLRLYGRPLLSLVRRRGWYHQDMTQLDVLYRYGAAPTEASMLALAKVREVYGVRRVAVNEAEKTIRVEYDATRLNEA